MARDFGGDFVEVHLSVAVEFGIAEMATQIAARQAHKGGGLADAQAFAFDGVEDFVDLQPLTVVAPDRQMVGALFGRDFA